MAQLRLEAQELSAGLEDAESSGRFSKVGIFVRKDLELCWLPYLVLIKKIELVIPWW